MAVASAASCSRNYPFFGSRLSSPTFSLIAPTVTRFADLVRKETALCVLASCRGGSLLTVRVDGALVASWGLVATPQPYT